MIFYLGTHVVNWLSKLDVPLFVSRRRLTTVRTLPVANTKWALDSGGFSELSMYGEWDTTPAKYASDVKRFTERIGNLEWAAIQDWMCEPHMLRKTGYSILEHQQKTIENYITLMEINPALPWTPVLQGWEAADYLRHIDMYAKANITLSNFPIVGLGSVCRRQHTDDIYQLAKLIHEEGISLHGFGVKTTGLFKLGKILTSADSMAWSAKARFVAKPMYSECTTHINCANCVRWALDWRDEVLAAVAT